MSRIGEIAIASGAAAASGAPTGIALTLLTTDLVYGIGAAVFVGGLAAAAAVLHLASKRPA